jgi:hypothetical protein
MQAGRERASLPLMRRFNEHSEKLLRATQSVRSSYGHPVWSHLNLDLSPLCRGRDPPDEPFAKRPRLESAKSRDEVSP